MGEEMQQLSVECLFTGEIFLHGGKSAGGMEFEAFRSSFTLDSLSCMSRGCFITSGRYLVPNLDGIFSWEDECLVFPFKTNKFNQMQEHKIIVGQAVHEVFMHAFVRVICMKHYFTNST